MMSDTIAIALVQSEGHTLPGHPENPQRFMHFGRLKELTFAERLVEIGAEATTCSNLANIHPQSYLDALEQAAARGPGFVDYGDTYVTPASFEDALTAVGGTIAVLEAVIRDEASCGFALVRPPGHHASAIRAGGFCLLNNIAIAADRARSLDLSRVMIVDFDVHHGNGTQDIFERDPNVLYLSTHQAGIYPGTGFVNEIGLGEGSGTVVNIPLPPRAGDVAFQKITQTVIQPIAKRFSPDILLISAGFDAHWNDPLASLQLSTTGYAQLGQALLEIADIYCEGRIVYVLEGGYDPEDLWDNVAAILFSLANLPPPPDRLGPAPFPESSIDSLLRNLQTVHKLPNS